MKKLVKIPPIIKPPPPEKIVGNLAWVAGDHDLLEYFKVSQSTNHEAKPTETEYTCIVLFPRSRFI